MDWPERIRQELAERDRREQVHTGVIEYAAGVARNAAAFKDKSKSLMRATAAAARMDDPSAMTGSVIARGGLSDTSRLDAHAAALETELAAVKNELSQQYKSQSSSAQRITALSDQLRKAEEQGRTEHEELHLLRHEVQSLRDRMRWHTEIVAEKDKALLALQDDNASLNLELSQLGIKLENLQTDNSNLLKRWLDSKYAEASKLNEANALEGI